MRWWKWIGLAGLAGVAATGVVAVRDDRRRHAYTPEEVRAKLHERVAEASAGSRRGDDTDGEPHGPAPS